MRGIRQNKGKTNINPLQLHGAIVPKFIEIGKKCYQIFLFLIKETRLPKKKIDDVRNY